MTKPSNFVHLHLHTEFSTLDSINRIHKVPAYVKKLGQVAVAITDHGTMAGVLKFNDACQEAGVKPILGIEAYWAQDRTVHGRDDDGRIGYHIVLLAMNNKGLHNLFKISSRAYTEGMYFKPRCDDELLREYSDNIIVTTACLAGRASRLANAGRITELTEFLESKAQMFPGRFYIEVQLHDDPEQEQANKVLMTLAKQLDIPLVVTMDSHYRTEEHKLLHEQVLCMSTGTTMANPNRLSYGDMAVHIGHHDYVWNLCQEKGIPYEAILNTRKIADQVDASTYFKDIKNRYPHFDALPENLTADEHLERVSKLMLYRRMGQMPPLEYRNRVDRELKVIKKMGFSNYLLIVHQFIEGAKSNGVLVGPGRGSAAGSLVCYALGLTQIDPIKYGLVFERFLNAGRASRPLIFTDSMRETQPPEKPHLLGDKLMRCLKQC